MRWLCATSAPLHVFYANGARKGQMKASEEEVREEKARVQRNTRTKCKKRGLEPWKC